MTILMIDGFDMYDNNGVCSPNQRGWLGAISFAGQAGRFAGSQAMYITGSANSLIWPMTVASPTVSMGIAYKNGNVGGLVATGSDLLTFSNGTTLQCKLGVKSDGSLVCGRGDFTTNIIGAATAPGLVTSNAWNYLEVELTRHASAGIFKVYLNGALVINATAANTGALDINRAALFGHPNQNNFYDDFYITDTAIRLGERRVEYLVPSADTATKDWTASTGTNHAALLDEVPTNGDNDYISDAVVGHKDLFDMANLSSTPATIDAVQTVLVARKDDATTRAIRTNFKNGATTSNGTTRSMAATFAASSDLYLVNPDTAAAWTVANVNAAQLGVEVVT